MKNHIVIYPITYFYVNFTLHTLVHFISFRRQEVKVGKLTDLDYYIGVYSSNLDLGRMDYTL